VLLVEVAGGPVRSDRLLAYWLVAAAVLEPEPLPTVITTTTTTKGRWRITGITGLPRYHGFTATSSATVRRRSA
jgi:hypothetical protein